MEPLRYLDFELKIIRKNRKRYTAQVLHSPAGEASISFEFPFSEVKLENLGLKLGRPRGSTRRIHSTEMEAARELGENCSIPSSVARCSPASRAVWTKRLVGRRKRGCA